MFRKIVVRLAIMLAALTLGVAVSATPAQATWSQCPTYAVCIFEGTSGGSPLYWWTEESWGTGCVNIGTSWNDRASSVYNRTPAWVSSVRFFEHSNCSGDHDPPSLWTYNGQMKTFGTGSGLTQYNNMISSFVITGV